MKNIQHQSKKDIKKLKFQADFMCFDKKINVSPSHPLKMPVKFWGILLTTLGLKALKLKFYTKHRQGRFIKFPLEEGRAE